MPDLNLLVTLDVVLTEGSVARAARRLRLSPSAMSRALARLRQATGDPLLVRAGRGLVATPRAMELRGRVGQLVHEAEAVLRPTSKQAPGEVVRTFTLRTREGFAETYGPQLIARVRQEAPGVRLCFLQKSDRLSAGLREGAVDLETGVIGEMVSPEVRAQALFRDHFVAVVRRQHPLSRGALTLSRYVKAEHVGVARRDLERERVDEALEALGPRRNLVALASGFASALAFARATDLVATVPARQTGVLRDGLVSLRLPFSMPELTVSLLWHPRLDADPAHRWLRGLVLKLVREVG